MLSRKPDTAWQKDKALYRQDGSLMRVPKFGSWSVMLKPDQTDEWDCGEAMLDLLKTLPSDPAIWHRLTERYSVSFFVGLNVEAPSRGFELSPAITRYLGERGISAGFDIYCETGAAFAFRSQVHSEAKTLYAAVHARVDEILHYVWDPIGIAGVSEARDEYNSYVPTVVRLLIEEKEEEKIAAFLHRIAAERMGLSESPATLAHEQKVAVMLLRHFQGLKRTA